MPKVKVSFVPDFGVDVFSKDGNVLFCKQMVFQHTQKRNSQEDSQAALSLHLANQTFFL